MCSAQLPTAASFKRRHSSKASKGSAQAWRIWRMMGLWEQGISDPEHSHPTAWHPLAPLLHSLGGCAAGNAHLKVVTIPMPRFRLGCHTLAILIQLPAAVSSSDFQGCLPVGQGKLKIISRVDKKKFRFGSVVSLGIQDRFINFKDLLIGTTNEGQK